MKEEIITALTNLIKIKSLVTLALTSAFVILALRGDIDSEKFLMIFTTVIAFYFGTQKVKETEVIEDESQIESDTAQENYWEA